jgi:hypothetical protein
MLPSHDHTVHQRWSLDSSLWCFISVEAPREVLAQMLSDNTRFEPHFQLTAVATSVSQRQLKRILLRHPRVDVLVALREHIGHSRTHSYSSSLRLRP